MIDHDVFMYKNNCGLDMHLSISVNLRDPAQRQANLKNLRDLFASTYKNWRAG